MTTTIPVHVVRVFTTESGALGNELGIVLNSADTAGRELEIARALGFSETVFVDGAGSGATSDPDALARPAVRIFTPACELPFAGHPTVGIAWWLAQQGTPPDVLAVPAGDVAVRFDGDTTWVTGRASWGPTFTWYEWGSVAKVDALDPDEYDEGDHYAYAYAFSDPTEAGDATTGARARIRSRMFAPAMSIAEDEATGSAAITLSGRLGRSLDITQGKGSRILTTYLGDEAGDGIVEVGGRTVLDADRTIELP